MSENFEFSKKESQPEDLFMARLVNEGIEINQSIRGGLDNRLGARQETSDQIMTPESLEAALNEAVQMMQSISERVQRLPNSIRDSLIGSISGMTGDKYPAYDALRLSIACDK